MHSKANLSILFCGTIFVVGGCVSSGPTSSRRQGSASDGRLAAGSSFQLDDCAPYDENSSQREPCVEPPPTPAPPPPGDPVAPPVAPPPAPLVQLDGVSICTAKSSSSFSPWTSRDLGNGKINCSRHLPCNMVFSSSETSNLVCSSELAAACAAIPPSTDTTLDYWYLDEPNPNGRSCDQIYRDQIRAAIQADPQFNTPEKVEAEFTRLIGAEDPNTLCNSSAEAAPVIVNATCSQRIPTFTNQDLIAVAGECPTGQSMGSPIEVPMCRLNWSNTSTTSGWAYVAEYGLNQGNNADFVCQYRHPCDGYGTLSNQSMPQSEDFDSEGNLTRICKTLGGDDCSSQSAAMNSSLAGMQVIINVLPSYRWNGVPPNQSEVSRNDFRTYVNQTCDAAVLAQKASLDATAASDCRAKADAIYSQGPKTLISCCQAGAAAP